MSLGGSCSYGYYSTAYRPWCIANQVSEHGLFCPPILHGHSTAGRKEEGRSGKLINFSESREMVRGNLRLNIFVRSLQRFHLRA